MLHRDSPIGIFDSGIGGLTVMRRIKERLPNERLVYFGDTARVPYGTKSPLAIRKYAAEDTALLLRYNPKLIVIACGTVSAVALDVVKETAKDIPVLGVIAACVATALEKTKTKKIGVIGTLATIASEAYPREIYAREHGATVFSKACPLFVPLAEEGFLNHEATRLIAHEYLADFKTEAIDTLILGCTHYPVLRPAIEFIMGNKVQIIDSGEAMALEVELVLASRDLLNLSKTTALHQLMVSDVPQKFKTVAELFLGIELPDVELVAT
jgi:glutamate racemase